MKRDILLAIVLGLSLTSTLPVEAQQRSASSRRSQTRPVASTTSENNNAGKTVGEDAATDSARVPDAPNAPGVPSSPGAPGAPGAPGVPRMGGFALMALPMQARQEASDSSGNVKTDAFLSAFMKAARAADADGDGKLTAEELNTLSPQRPAQRPEGGRPQGRNSRENNFSVDNVGSDVVRAQDSSDSRSGERRPQGRGPGMGGPQGNAPQNPLFKAISDSIDEKDGSVDLGKLENALKKALDEADSDSNGLLNAEEWNSFAGGFGGPGRGGMGGPGGMGGFAPNMNPNAMRAMQIMGLQNEAQTAALSEDGNLDIAKFRSEFVRLLKEADTNGDGLLKEDELQAMQQKMMERMQKEMQERMQNGGGPGMGGPGFGPGGPGFGPGMGGPRPENGGNQQPPRRNDDVSFVAPSMEGTTVVRGQEPDDGENTSGASNRPGRGEMRGPGGNGGPRPGGMGGFGGPGRGGMGGPGGPGMGGFGMGMGGFGGFGRSGSNAVQSAAVKAMSESGDFNIANFDKELGKVLADADNEDDGVLDSIEQIDAFGRALRMAGPRPERPQGREAGEGRGNRGPEGDNSSRERGPQGRPDGFPQGRPEGAPQGRGNGGPNGGPQGRANEGFEELMRARSLPTPDSDLFVAVPANENFKFSKPFAKDGSAEKSPIEADYAIGKYEVRNREYKEFVDATKRSELPKTWVDGSYAKGMKNCPVVGVTLKDAEDYCEWLASKYEGWTFRLPTEAEFENAAAGPQKQLYPWGKTSGFTYTKGELTAPCQYNARVASDLIEKKASITISDKTTNVSDVVTITNKGVLSKGWRDSKSKTGFTYSNEFAAMSKIGGYVVPVYKFQDNRSLYGCVGLSGNAAEWTSTVIDGKNVVRGGSWYSSAEECAATYRGESQDPARGTPTVGFRVVAEKI